MSPGAVRLNPTDDRFLSALERFLVRRDVGDTVGKFGDRDEMRIVRVDLMRWRDYLAARASHAASAMIRANASSIIFLTPF